MGGGGINVSLEFSRVATRAMKRLRQGRGRRRKSVLSDAVNPSAPLFLSRHINCEHLKKLCNCVDGGNKGRKSLFSPPPLFPSAAAVNIRTNATDTKVAQGGGGGGMLRAPLMRPITFFFRALLAPPGYVYTQSTESTVSRYRPAITDRFPFSATA